MSYRDEIMKISIEQSRWAILCDAAEIVGRAEARIHNLERLLAHASNGEKQCNRENCADTNTPSNGS